MSLQSIFGLGIKVLREKPSLVLVQLAVLFVVQILLSLFYMSLGLSPLPTSGSVMGRASLATTNLPVFAGTFLILVIVGIVLSQFSYAFYIGFAQQAYERKKISVGSSIKQSKKRLWPLIKTTLLGGIIILLSLLIPIVLVLWSLALASFHSFGNALIILGLLFVLLMIVIVFAVAFFLLDVVVVLERVSGVDALKRSAAIARKDLLPLLAVIIIISFVSVIVYAVVGASVVISPYLEVVLALVLGAFLQPWVIMATTAFYYEFVKKRVLPASFLN